MVQVAVGLVALLAALVVPEAPGVGLLLLAVAVAAVVVLVRPAPTADQADQAGRRPPRSRWQAVHGAAAVLLTASAALRDAAWVVSLCLLGALLLGALALAPAGSWPAVLLAPLRPVGHLAAAAGWLVRGVDVALGRAASRLLGGRGKTAETAQRRWRRLAPLVRAVALTAVLLAVFVPLLSSADARFGAFFTGAATWLDTVLVQLGTWLGTTRVDVLVGRTVVFVLAALAVTAALVVSWDPRPAAGSRPTAGSERSLVLSRRVEWLLPLGVLDALFAAFLLVRLTAPEPAGATLAGQLHAGFAQLVVATALVLGVVALAVRWTPMTTGPRAALAVLCLLSLGLDAAAVADLVAYVEAYGLTRLRVSVAAICAGLAGLLVLLVVAGCRRRQDRDQRWVPHAAVVVAAACLGGLAASNPDALVARSQLTAPAQERDTAYVLSLSADAVPAAAAALRADPDALGPGGACSVAWMRDAPGGGWASANLARWRADRALRTVSAC